MNKQEIDDNLKYKDIASKINNMNLKDQKYHIDYTSTKLIQYIESPDPELVLAVYLSNEDDIKLVDYFTAEMMEAIWKYEPNCITSAAEILKDKLPEATIIEFTQDEPYILSMLSDYQPLTPKIVAAALRNDYKFETFASHYAMSHIDNPLVLEQFYDTVQLMHGVQYSSLEAYEQGTPLHAFGIYFRYQDDEDKFLDTLDYILDNIDEIINEKYETPYIEYTDALHCFADDIAEALSKRIQNQQLTFPKQEGDQEKVLQLIEEIIKHCDEVPEHYQQIVAGLTTPDVEEPFQKVRIPSYSL